MQSSPFAAEQASSVDTLLNTELDRIKEEGD
jgi:hypothetical protein